MSDGDPQGAWTMARKRVESPTKRVQRIRTGCTQRETKGRAGSGGRCRVGPGKCHSRHVLLCDCHGGGESLSADRYDEGWIVKAEKLEVEWRVEAGVRAREICGFVEERDIWHTAAWHMAASMEMDGRGAAYDGIEMLCW